MNKDTVKLICITLNIILILIIIMNIIKKIF